MRRSALELAVAAAVCLMWSASPVDAQSDGPAVTVFVSGCSRSVANDMRRLIALEQEVGGAGRGARASVEIRCDVNGASLVVTHGGQRVSTTVEDEPDNPGFARLVALRAVEVLLAEEQRLAQQVEPGRESEGRASASTSTSTSTSRTDETRAPQNNESPLDASATDAPQGAQMGERRWALDLLGSAELLLHERWPHYGGALRLEHWPHRIFGWRAALRLQGGRAALAVGQVTSLDSSGTLSAAVRLTRGDWQLAGTVGVRAGFVRWRGDPTDAMTRGARIGVWSSGAVVGVDAMYSVQRFRVGAAAQWLWVFGDARALAPTGPDLRWAGPRIALAITLGVWLG